MKLVKVVWTDSRGANPRWNYVSTVKDHGVCKIMSVGWLVHETKKHITLAPNVSDRDPDGDYQVCGEMHIPKSCIVKRQTLKT